MGSGQVVVFCRIPLSSCHPQIPVWCLNKPRLLIMNRADMVSQQDQQEWSNYYGSQGLSVFNTDANNGKGITKVTHCIHFASFACQLCVPGQFLSAIGYLSILLLPLLLLCGICCCSCLWLLTRLRISAPSGHHPYFTPPLYQQHAVQRSMQQQHSSSSLQKLLHNAQAYCSSCTCTMHILYIHHTYSIHIPYRSPKQHCYSARASMTRARPEGCSLDQSEQLSLAFPMSASQP